MDVVKDDYRRLVGQAMNPKFGLPPDREEERLLAKSLVERLRGLEALEQPAPILITGRHTEASRLHRMPWHNAYHPADHRAFSFTRSPCTPTRPTAPAAVCSTLSRTAKTSTRVAIASVTTHATRLVRSAGPKPVRSVTCALICPVAPSNAVSSADR